MRLTHLVLIGVILSICYCDDGNESDGDASRKILGSSVVTSVSVVMDTNKNKNAIFMDAVGKPQSKPSNPSELASPIDLLNPDRYEFYTFDDNGDLVKRLMSLEEIRSIIATGDSDVMDFDTFTSQGFLPEKRVSDVVTNVQSVVKDEMEILKDPIMKPIFDTPDVSDSWSMILPAVFGNSGEDIKPEKPVGYVTPDTIMIEPSTTAPQKIDAIISSITTTKRPTVLPVYYTSSKVAQNASTTAKSPISVEIISNGISSTDFVTEQTSISSETTPTRPVTSSTTQRPQLIRNTTKTTTEKPSTKPIQSNIKVTLSETKSGSTVKPSTNIFGFPTKLVVDKPKIKPTARPVSNIFGFPGPETKNNPTSTTRVKPTSTTTRITSPTTTSTTTTTTTSTTSTTTTTSAPTTVWAPSEEDIQLFNIFKDTLAQSVAVDQIINATEEENSNEAFTTEESNIQDVLSFESNKIQTTESFEDLHTLPSENLHQHLITQETTQLPTLLNSLNDYQKISASELLDQLLVTTNINEINTELASSKPNATTEDIPNSTTVSEQQTTTTDYFVSSPPTTDITLIHSIEELLSQAVGDVQAVLNETDINREVTTTTEPEVTSTTETITTTENSLSDSMEALLSQIVDDTPTKFIDNTEKPTTEFLNASNSEPQQAEDTTYYYVVKTTTEEPHLINITVISSSDKKPAKSDVSLEQAIIEEEMKNMSMEQQDVSSDSKIVEVQKEELTTLQVDTTTSNVETTTETETTTLRTTTVPPQITTKRLPKPSIVITINENNTVVKADGKIVANKTIPHKNFTQDPSWTLISTVAPQQINQSQPLIPYPDIPHKPVPVDLVPKPMQGFGLEDSTSTLDVDVHQFIQLCNELAFGFWKTVTTGLSPARSIFVSPFAATSMLAMVFLGAKGATSEEMNEILKLDDMVTFNPHLIFKGISESIISEPNSGIATTAIIRELFSDRSKGKLLEFYKNRVKAFYDGYAEEVSYREIGDVIRRRSNLLVKKYTNGKYQQFFNDATIVSRAPLSGVSINIFETDCSQTSAEGRDGELYFVIFPSIKQRRLVPVPAVVYKSGFLAGYEPSLDATAVAIGTKDQVVSTILVVPGQQGIAAPGDGLARLEKRLVESSFKKGAWSRLLRSLIPRPGLEIQIPRFSHRSVINATHTLQRMGLHELFNPDSADLRGLNGVPNELHLSDVLQVNKFATCGERSTEAHHSEIYPATTMRGRAARRLDYFPMHDYEEPRDYQRAFNDPLHNPTLLSLPLSLRPRQARLPEVPRLRFDRPFLYFVRHNPTGLILHMGRFNPRLLP